MGDNVEKQELDAKTMGDNGEKTRTGVVECISALPTSGKDNVILFSVNLDCTFNW